MLGLLRAPRRPPQPGSDARSTAARRYDRRDLALATCLLFLANVITAPQARAATAANGITVISFGNDLWVNYDMNSKSSRSDNVDWAINLLFINNATIDKTKSKMEDWTNYFDDSSTEKKYGRVSNYYDSDWQWDADGGKKRPICPAFASANHYRVYSGTTDAGYERLYNTTLGYYVIGSTHRDWDECGGSKRHGSSETVENLLISVVDENTAVHSDWWNLYNNEPYRVEGNHTWSNNGLASEVRIP